MTIRYWFLIACVAALPACATDKFSAVTAAAAPPAERALSYNRATRLVRLSDGSDFLLMPHESPNERVSIEGLLVSAKGRDSDRAFRVSRWIPDLVGDGTIGQIYSAALSPDGNWLATTGGWWGRDQRGHNGVFLMHRNNRNGLDFFDLKSWFDVPGLTIGDIEFGPDDTLLTMSQENRPDLAASIVTVFSYAGQNLGSFISSPTHGDPRSSAFARVMRLSRTGSSSFAIYDPEAAAVRWVRISGGGAHAQVIEERKTPIAAERPRIPVLAFSVSQSGSLILARNVSENGHPRTVVSAYGPDGREIEKVQPTDLWTYGSADQSTVHGYSKPHSTEQIVHSTVSIH